MDKRKKKILVLLIEQIRKSNVWDIKSKEYKDTNVRNDIFEAAGNFFSRTKRK
jgi:hypothetical protein